MSIENIANSGQTDSANGWEEFSALGQDKIERVAHDAVVYTAEGGGLREGYFQDRDFLNVKKPEYHLTKNQIIQDDLMVGPLKEPSFDLTVQKQPENNVDIKANNGSKSEILRQIKALDESGQMNTLEGQTRMRELTASLDSMRKGSNPEVNSGQIEDKAAQNRAILIDKQQLEAEAKDKLEAEAKAKLEAEERAKGRIKEIDERIAEIDKELAPFVAQHEAEERARQRLKEIDARLAEIDKELGPLAAVNVNFEYDKKELAHDLAEQELNKDNSRAGLIKRIWKGNLFKKYYEQKYTRELMEGKRKIKNEKTGEYEDLDDLIEKRSDSVVARFVKGATEDMGYIHTKIGKDGKNGEKLDNADARTTEIVKSAIEKYAMAELKEGESLEDLRIAFGNDIARIKAEARDRGEKVNEKFINNYYEVAVQARERVEHGMAIERVMDGFKVYEAEARSGVRTQAHRDSIDKITDKITSGKVGRFIPPEIVAGALGAAAALTQTGARALGGAGVGIAASGVMAGLKERNRVTEDRTRMMRDVANGLGYGDKQSKYEKRLGGTMYDLRPAGELVSMINAAKESNNEEAILRALAEAEVRVTFSDTEEKDLISYSSEDKRGEERLALDTARIETKQSLSDDAKAKLAEMKKQIISRIGEEVDEKDADFKRVRALRAVKQAGKTMAIGAATFFISQEVMAALDPGKIGLLEKAGIIKTENTTNAKETILAGLAGPRQIDTINNVSGDDSAAIRRYENAGYKGTKVKDAWSELKTDVTDVNPANSADKMNIIRDEWANNGTTISDGNELRAYIQNGSMISSMTGNSTTMSGQTLNYESLLNAGKIKGFVTLPDGSSFEAVGSLNQNGVLQWLDNGILTTPSGSTMRVIGENGEALYKYFEIAVDQGVDASGIQHIIPLATDVTNVKSFTGTIQKAVEKIVEHPAEYSFTKVRDVFMGGVAVPIASRRGIGEARRNNNITSPEPPELSIESLPVAEAVARPTAETTNANIGQNTENNQEIEKNPDKAIVSPGSGIFIGQLGQFETVSQEVTQDKFRTLEDYNNANGFFRAKLENNKSLIGGDEGVSLMMDTSPYSPDEDAIYANWWNSLSNDAKARISVNLNRMGQISDNVLVPWNSNLRSWLYKNGFVIN